MITRFNIFEGIIHAEIDPYEEEIWDENKYILISDLKIFDELKCKSNIGALKTRYRYKVTKVLKDSVIVWSERGDVFVFDEETLNEYFELVVNSIVPLGEERY